MKMTTKEDCEELARHLPRDRYCFDRDSGILHGIDHLTGVKYPAVSCVSVSPTTYESPDFWIGVISQELQYWYRFEIFTIARVADGNDWREIYAIRLDIDTKKIHQADQDYAKDCAALAFDDLHAATSEALIIIGAA